MPCGGNQCSGGCRAGLALVVLAYKLPLAASRDHCVSVTSPPPVEPFLTLNRPTIIHAATGLGSALLSVYRMQHGIWSVASKVTVGVAGAWLVITIPYFAVGVFVVLP